MIISKQEAARKRMTRSSILFILYNHQEGPTPIRAIELSMLPENPQIGSDLVSQINYLNDRGYIKVIEPDTPTMNPMRGALVRITDKGQDVVEGTIVDDGIVNPDDR